MLKAELKYLLCLILFAGGVCPASIPNVKPLPAIPNMSGATNNAQPAQNNPLDGLLGFLNPGRNQQNTNIPAQNTNTPAQNTNTASENNQPIPNSPLQNLMGFLSNTVQQSSPLQTNVATLGKDVIGLGMNSLGRVVSNTDAVVKGTDGVLNEGATQFQRINSVNANLLKGCLQTKGTAAVKAGSIGTNILGRIENMIAEPDQYMNPFPFLKKFIPFLRPSAEEQLRENLIENGLKKLREDKSTIYYALYANPTVLSFLRQKPNTFLYMLQNPDQLQALIDNSSLLLQMSNLN